MSKGTIPKFDYLTRHGAGILADGIEAHWRARGYDSIAVERYEIGENSGTFGVRSNIGTDGFPPGPRPKQYGIGGQIGSERFAQPRD